MKKPGALKGSVALKQMPEKMQELFRVHFADKDNGKDFLHLLKYCRENKYDYKDVLAQLDGIMQGTSDGYKNNERRNKS